jgi:hypothetical protein
VVIDCVLFIGSFTIRGCRAHGLFRGEGWSGDLEPGSRTGLESGSGSKDTRRNGRRFWNRDSPISSIGLPGCRFRTASRFMGVSPRHCLVRFRDVRWPIIFGDQIFLLNLLDGTDFMPVVTLSIAEIRRRQSVAGVQIIGTRGLVRCVRYRGSRRWPRSGVGRSHKAVRE